MAGPPCSGKTTYAKKLLKENPNLRRLSRDDLRSMLHGSYVFDNRYTETFITKIITLLADELRSNGKSVLIDATHCKMKYIDDIVNSLVKTPDDLSRVQIVVMRCPYWLQRVRNLYRYLRTGMWIPSKVSKDMNKNYRKLLEELKIKTEV